ncbi:MAG: flagellar hook-length control protein FliK [Bermanella sp.]|jgi:flagellar hook-length control protein FliK
MPASPLLAIIAPSAQTVSTSSLSQGMPSKSGALSPLQPTEPLSTNLDGSESGLSFFQQLQMANEQSALPMGQEFAAYMPQAQLAVTMDDASFVGPLAQTTMLEEDSLNANVLYAQPMQAPLMQTTELGAPQGLSYLESLRQAQPHVQTGAQVQQGASSVTLEGEALTDEMSTGLNKPLNTTLAEPLPSQPMPPTKAQLAAEEAVNPNSAITAQANKMFNLDELGMEAVTDDTSLEGADLESLSIHEAPKTLATAKEVNAASALAQPTEVQTLTEAKASFSDITPGAMRDPQASKSLALDQPSSAQPQAAEKSAASFNKLDIPPQHPQWNDQVAKRISIMASESVQSARIQLDPPELGALEVKIKVQHDQVSVSFGSNNQMVREALDAQTPRLRELLEQQGINLADVNVSEQGAQSGQGRDETLADGFAGDGDIGETERLDEALTASIESDSLVDYFA